MLAQDERLTTRVGAAAIAVIAALAVFFVFVYGRIEWHDQLRARLYFKQTGELREGAAVVLGGQDVGVVEAIALSPAGAPNTPLAGDEGVVVSVAIDARAAAKIRRGGEVFISSRGVVGARYVEFGPAPIAAPALAAGDELRGSDPPSLDRVVQRSWDDLQSDSRSLAELRPALDPLRAQLRQLQAELGEMPSMTPLRANLIEFAANAAQTYEVGLGGHDGIAQLRETIANARATMATADAAFAQLSPRIAALRAQVTAVGDKALASTADLFDRVDAANTRARAVIAKVDPLLAKVDALAAMIERGEGTVGKLMHDPEFPEEAKDLGRVLKRQPWRVIGHP